MYGRLRWVILLVSAGQVCAQGSERGQSRGFVFYGRFQSSANSVGWVSRLDTSAGYNLDSHVSILAGVPIYFVHPSSSTTAATGARSANGMGDVYGQLRLTLANPAINFISTLTATAPTGDQADGFSTGKVTVDWSNYFDRSFGRITPFAEVGLANSTSDALFFVRPYISSGFVAHAQGGARYRLARAVSAAGSFYAIEPSGQQTVVSRVAPANSGSVTPGNSKGKKDQGVFATSNTTTGTADIARDHGFSAWLQLTPASPLSFYAGYTRSVPYDLDTFFIGVGVSLGNVFRHGGF